MNNDLESLRGIGFEYAGKWVLDNDGKIKPDLDKTKEKLKNVLYAFVVNEKVMYVGKTVRELRERIMNYRNCIGEGQYTEPDVNDRIKDALNDQKEVLIHVLTNNNVNLENKEILSMLNYTAGLEDGLIEELKLRERGWNKY
jgi:hypothetical protein